MELAKINRFNQHTARLKHFETRVVPPCVVRFVVAQWLTCSSDQPKCASSVWGTDTASWHCDSLFEWFWCFGVRFGNIQESLRGHKLWPWWTRFAGYCSNPCPNIKCFLYKTPKWWNLNLIRSDTQPGFPGVFEGITIPNDHPKSPPPSPRFAVEPDAPMT